MSSRKVPLLCDDHETIGDAGCTRAFCFVVVGIFGDLSIRGVVCPALTLRGCESFRFSQIPVVLSP